MVWAIAGTLIKVFNFTMRFDLRAKLLLLSSFLFVIPWFGYQYVWEMEKYLRYGQEQTLVGTARALATALHERPNLFNNQASFLPSVEKGKDLYGYQLKEPIRLDGIRKDWPKYQKPHYYNNNNLLKVKGSKSNVSASISFSASVGKYDKYLYMFFTVRDNKVVFRGKNNLSITDNDHLQLSFINTNNQFKRFVISNKQPGWLSAFALNQVQNIPLDVSKNNGYTREIPTPAPQIQGQWLTTPQGYNIELRMPLASIGDKIAFAFNDIDNMHDKIITRIGSADPNNADTLGTVLVPSPEIERIVNGMSHTNSSIWVVDQHHRVLASAGSLKTASGFWQTTKLNDQVNNSLWTRFKTQALLPLYYMILTKPPTDFIDQLYDAQHLTGAHIVTALSGQAKSQWRLTSDEQALVLSAAYPIFINKKVKGAVIVEETTNSIRTLRNKALEKLFTAILAIMVFGALAFVVFASRITTRISSLSNQAELAIDEHGRITGEVIPSSANDEIGDLSRSFARAVNRLKQYNHYLENMSSRLSHELRTPIAVVKTSLENLSLQSEQIGNVKNTAYIERAQTGINTLNLILTNMSEATHLEQILVNTEKTLFDIRQLIRGCTMGYKHIYPEINFKLSFVQEKTHEDKLMMYGSAEHIVQLLDKVVNNAVEFSTDKQINLCIKQCKNTLEIKISNNGIHLPKVMLNSLFDSMVSIRSKSKQNQPHLGLGLYIARLICQFHQGEISAKNHSKPEGVSITMTLPLGVHAI